MLLLNSGCRSQKTHWHGIRELMYSEEVPAAGPVLQDTAGHNHRFGLPMGREQGGCNRSCSNYVQQIIFLCFAASPLSFSPLTCASCRTGAGILIAEQEAHSRLRGFKCPFLSEDSPYTG